MTKHKGVQRRWNKLWIRVPDPRTKKWVWKSTGLVVGQEETAAKARQAVLERIKAGKEIAPQQGPLTVEAYAKRWLEARKARDLRTESTEDHITLHIVPRLGRMLLTDVRPRHVLEMMRELEHVKVRGKRSKGFLAPRTRRHIYATLRSIYDEAIVDGLVDTSPCKLKRHHLPRDADKDPKWRDGAIFTREEIIALISSVQLDESHRILWAMTALGGPRASSLVVRRWGDIDFSAKPLPKMSMSTKWRRDTKKIVEGSKTGIAIYVPIHPTLAQMLRHWWLNGWYKAMERRPTPDDFIVPRTFGKHKGEHRTAGSLWLALQRDLDTLKMRRRREHDLRASFVTWARADGARADIIKWISHGPSRRDIVDIYTRLPWETLCAEVAKLRIELPAQAVAQVSQVGGVQAVSTAFEDGGDDSKPAKIQAVRDSGGDGR